MNQAHRDVLQARKALADAQHHLAEVEARAAAQKAQKVLKDQSMGQAECSQTGIIQVAERCAAMKSLGEQEANFLQNETGDEKKEGFTGTKPAGDPMTLLEQDTDWLGWMFQFGTWILCQFENGSEILYWAVGLGEQEVSEEKMVSPQPDEVAKGKVETLMVPGRGLPLVQRKDQLLFAIEDREQGSRHDIEGTGDKLSDDMRQATLHFEREIEVYLEKVVACTGSGNMSLVQSGQIDIGPSIKKTRRGHRGRKARKGKDPPTRVKVSAIKDADLPVRKLAESRPRAPPAEEMKAKER